MGRNLLSVIMMLVLLIGSYTAQEKNALLWKITGNGTTTPSYLYGTMHVSQKLAFHLGDDFYEALESVDVVGLEIDPKIWMDQLQETDLLQDNYILSSRTNLYFNSIKFPKLEDYELSKHLSSDARLINGLLFRSQVVREEYEEETYLDLYIYQTARRLNKETVGLENFREVNKLEIKSMMPIPEDEVNEELKNLYEKKAKELRKKTVPLGQQMEEAYREGNIEMIDTLSHIFNARGQFQKYMVDERNIGMAQQMDSIIQSGKSLFTGVGAAHLPGELGVIKLMREKGYQVEPIQRAISGRSKKYKKKLDPIIVPMNWSKQSTPDKKIELGLPGKLYPMPREGSVSTFIHPDMANGVYYWVKRIKTYDFLHPNKNGKDLNQRIEQLLFENIPGTIITQEKTTIGGQPAIVITNKTRKGDDQKHIVIQTPLELILIKMGGQDDYVKRYGDNTFELTGLNYNITNQWKEVSPPEGVFKINMPELNLIHRMPSGYKNAGPAVEIQGVNSENEFFIARRVSFQDYYYLEEDEFEFNLLLDNLCEELKLNKLSSKIVQKGKYNSIQSKAINPISKRIHHIEFIIQANNYYLLLEQSNNEERNASFFDSFAIEDHKYEQEFKVYMDSAANVSVQAPEQSDLEQKLMKGMFDSYSYSGKKKKNNGMSYKTWNVLVNSSFTGEQVKIFKARYAALDYFDNLDSLWNAKKKFYHKDEANMKVINEKRSTSNGYNILDFDVTKEGSSQVIKVRWLQKDQNAYKIFFLHDDVTPLSPFYDSILNSFKTHADTLPKFDLFEDKRSQFFAMLDSGDSLQIMQAFDDMYGLSYEDEDEQLIIDNIDQFHSKFGKFGLTKEDKSDLIVLMNRFETSSSIKYLNNLYHNNEDTVSYQIAALKALADIETKESYDIIKELLLEFTPIPQSSEEIDQVYNRFYDTLELASSIFPDAIFLNQYVEYKEANLALMGRLVDDGLLDISDLSKFKKGLISDANIEFKRNRADLEEEDESRYRYEYTHDYDKYSYTKGYSNELESYLPIIARWYSKEIRAKEIFEKIERLKDGELKIRALVELKKANVQLPKGVFDSFAKDPKTVYTLFDYLQFYNQLDEIKDPNTFTDSTLALGAIHAEYTIKDDEQLSFLRKDTMFYKGKSRVVYFYKREKINAYSKKSSYNMVASYKMEYEKDEKYAYYSVAKGDNLFEYSTESEINELIADWIDEKEYKERERYSNPNNYGNGLYDLGF